jgi:hypothetical protein
MEVVVGRGKGEECLGGLVSCGARMTEVATMDVLAFD